MQRFAIVFAALLAPLFACDAQQAPGDETYYEDGTVVLSERESEAPGGICECTTNECANEWILENFGCGVCVLSLCGDEQVGGCVICDEDQQAAPERPTAAETDGAFGEASADAADAPASYAADRPLSHAGAR